jgi:hypothetical protein
MIKKFEEFVNENYGSKYRRGTLTSRDLDKLERIFIDEFGLKKELVRLKEMMVRMQMANGIYTFEEITEILYKIKSVLKTSDYAFKDYAFVLIKHLFDENLSVKEREEVLNDFCETYKLELPIVFDINGKMITGEVYYSEALNAYAKDEDDFIEAGDEWLSIQANEEGILDDDQPDWVSDNWDMLDIYEVDLDKEYLDKETNRWTKR